VPVTVDQDECGHASCNTRARSAYSVASSVDSHGALEQMVLRPTRFRHMLVRVFSLPRSASGASVRIARLAVRPRCWETYSRREVVAWDLPVRHGRRALPRSLPVISPMVQGRLVPTWVRVANELAAVSMEYDKAVERIGHRSPAGGRTRRMTNTRRSAGGYRLPV
jgi:hypothetical protein